MRTTAEKHKKASVTLAGDTVALLDRVAKKADRSRLITTAVRFYVHRRGLRNLRKQLQEGALNRAVRDRTLAEEWFSLEY
jgi:CopG family transcriptional regulator/antitoxin EndoAI